MAIFVPQTLLPLRTDPGAAFSTFTTKQDISPVPVPVARAGQLFESNQLWLKAHGEYSSLTGASLTLGFWIGTAALAITTSLAETSVFTTGTTPTAWPWELEWSGTIISIGPTGSIVGSGKCWLGASLTAFTAGNPVPFPITQGLRTVTIDTTIDRAFGVSATWGASSGSNTIKTNHLQATLLA